MKEKSIDLLTLKLKNAPESILERVIGYVDALIEPAINLKTHYLTNEQQDLLDSQLNPDKNTYADAETLYSDLRKEYEI